MLELKKVQFIIGKDKTKNVYKLSALMVVGALLDALSIAFILPVINVFFNKDNFNLNFLNFEINFSSYSYEKTLLTMLFIFVLIFVIKNLYLRFVLIKQSKFIANTKAEISLKIYKKYLNFEQTFVLKNNSSIFLRNLKTEARVFVGYYLQSLLILFIDSILVLLLIMIVASVDILLFWVGFFIFGTTSIIYFLFFKKNIKVIGENRQRLEGEEFKLIQETFRSIKDIKLFNAKNYFNDIYKKISFPLANFAAKYQVISSSLKYLFEVILIITLSIMIIILTFNKYPLEEIISIIGVFIATSLRLIPSINKIIVSLQNLKFSKKALDAVYSILEKEDEMVEYDKTQKISFSNFLELKNITFKYPDNPVSIIKDFSAIIQKGTFIGFFGKSGSGKTTILNLVTGLMNGYNGTILVDNTDIRKNIYKWRSKFSYVTQDINLNDASIASNIAFGINEELIDQEKLINASKFAKIYEYIEKLPNKFNTTVGELGFNLSGGQVQRIAIARAIYKGSEILVFDEATNSLSKEVEEKIIKDLIELKKKKITIMFSTHNLNLKDYFDQIIEID